MPASLMDDTMMTAAERHQIGQLGRTLVSPVLDMVPVGPLRASLSGFDEAVDNANMEQSYPNNRSHAIGCKLANPYAIRDLSV